MKLSLVWMRRSMCVALTSMSVCGLLRAEGLLDSVRLTDLNDYALGVALSTSQNPFAGAGSSTFAYPYLTALEHPAFNRNWFVLRDGDVGVRHVTDGEWEVGWMARVQTLGLGDADNPELTGLLDRRWTVESGPMIGWRRLPVHLGLKLYWELLDRHDGYTAELALSLPREFEWGYLVPSVELKYLSDAYSGYYYDVRPGESSLSRPAYQAGSAVNPYAAIRLGYRISPRWMLTGKVGIEFLAAEIRDSPIVDARRVWSSHVGLAYNADLFRARDYDRSDGFPQSLELRVGAFSSAVNSTAQRVSADGRPGQEVDIESLLGVPGRDTALQVDVVMRFAFYHRLEAGYFAFDRAADTVLAREVIIGDAAFDAGTAIETSQDTETLQFVYGYSLLRDAQKELGVSAGLHYTRSSVEIASEEGGRLVQLETEAPLPTIGAFASVALSNRWTVQGEARIFRLDFDRYHGNMSFFAVRLERTVGRHLAAGAGFNYYATRLEGRDASLRGTYRATHHGPLLYVGVQF